MAIYVCDDCSEFKDDDYDPACDNPTDPTTSLCESCADERLYVSDLKRRYYEKDMEK